MKKTFMIIKDKDSEKNVPVINMNYFVLFITIVVSVIIATKMDQKKNEKQNNKVNKDEN